MEYSNIDPNTGKITKVYDLDDCLKAIKVRNEDNEKRIKSLEDKNRQLRDSHYKDEEMQKMKSELEVMREEYYRGFPITKEEQEAIETWKVDHSANAHGLKTIEDRLRVGRDIGGSYTYEFIPTSIGVIGYIKCQCGEKYCFSDIK